MAAGGTGRMGRALAAAFLAMAMATGGAAPALAEEAQDDGISVSSSEAVAESGISAIEETAPRENAAGEPQIVAEAEGQSGGAVLKASANERYWYFSKSGRRSSEYLDGYVIQINGVKSGSASYNGKTKTLTINNLKANSIWTNSTTLKGKLTIVLKGKNVLGKKIDKHSWYEGMNSSNSVLVKGSGSIENKTYLRFGDYTMRGGKISGSGDISCEDFTMRGGKISGSGDISCEDFTMRGGKISGSGDISCEDFTMRGGKITGSGGISCDNLTMKKGTIALKNTDSGIYLHGSSKAKACNFRQSGGSISLVNPSEDGDIEIQYGNMTITGGSLSITKAHDTGITVFGRTYRSKRYGGKVKVTGGKLTVQCRDADDSAIYADSMTNKVSCLKKINGVLPYGAKFKVGANVYKRLSYGALISSYGSSQTSVTFNTIKYGGCLYGVRGVDTNAFNTTSGKKVKSLTFKFDIGEIAPYAFSGAKALQTIVFEADLDSDCSIGKYAFDGTSSLTMLDLGWIPYNYSYSGDSYVYEFYTRGTWANTAFKGAGANGGAKLVVKLNDHSNEEYYVTAKKFLQKYGLSAKAKVA